MHQNPNAPPINPLPPVVVALVMIIAGIEGFFSLGRAGLIGGPEAIGWRLTAIRDYGFSGDILRWMIKTGQVPPDQLVRFVTYPFVHFTFTQALFVVVFLLALGKTVGEVFRPWAVLLVFFASAIMGALAYGLLTQDPRALVGGFPAVYGLIGAFTFLLWVNLAAKGANKYRAFTLIGFLLFIQLVFGILFGGRNDWVADLAGFATGFLLSFIVSPGGWSHLLARLRKR